MAREGDALECFLRDPRKDAKADMKLELDLPQVFAW